MMGWSCLWMSGGVDQAFGLESGCLAGGPSSQGGGWQPVTQWAQKGKQQGWGSAPPRTRPSVCGQDGSCMTMGLTRLGMVPALFLGSSKAPRFQGHFGS